MTRHDATAESEGSFYIVRQLSAWLRLQSGDSAADVLRGPGYRRALVCRPVPRRLILSPAGSCQGPAGYSYQPRLYHEHSVVNGMGKTPRARPEGCLA